MLRIVYLWRAFEPSGRLVGAGFEEIARTTCLMVVGESNTVAAAYRGERCVLSEYWSEESFMKKRHLRFAGWETNTSATERDLNLDARAANFPIQESCWRERRDLRLYIGDREARVLIGERDPALPHCLNTSLLS